VRLLLDTHTLMWALSESSRLSPKVREAILNPAATIFISVISLWEIVTKRQIGKLEFYRDINEVVRVSADQNGFILLGFELWHLVALESLPLHHRDPFDRALISQAIADDLTLVSRDTSFSQYPVSTLW
jgi:PIN domain nuclease of toxin-antitoxin system